MSAQKASMPVKFARSAAAALMIVLAGAVVIRLAGRRGGGPPAAAVEAPPEGRVVDLKERVRRKEYRDGKLRADIRGDGFFLGPDGRNHLKGSVEVTDYGPAGDIVSRTKADEVVYDVGAVLLTLSGLVRVEAGGVVLEGGSFDYDQGAGLFRTPAGGSFSSDRMAGTAADISYSESADEVRLGGGFRVGFAAGRDGAKNVLSGDSFVYHRRERRGRVEGRAEFSGEGCRGSARTLSFDMSEDESYLVSIAFDGTAEVVLAGRGSGNTGRGELRADRVGVSFRPGMAGPATVEAGGDARLSLPSADGSRSVFRAPGARLICGADGGPEKWSVSGGFRAELEDATGEKRVLEGESADGDVRSRVLKALGKPGRPAVADWPGARVEAASIAAGPADRDLAASDGVKCLLKPGEGSRTAGFFSAAAPVFVSSQSLVFRGDAGTYSFSGEVQAWQDREFLLAVELDVLGGTGDLKARGGAAVGLVQAAAGETAGRRVEVGGEGMSYSAAGRVLSFRQNSYVQLPGARLSAETVDAALDPEGKGLETLTASRNVVVSKGRYEGRGDAAFYQAGADRLTLTGRPVLVDRRGGSSRGDKLTFDLGDGKILLENEGQGRSTTVVKS